MKRKDLTFGMRRIKVNVTKDIINANKFRGIGNFPINDGTLVDNCPISWAIINIFPEARIGGHFIRPFGLSNDDTANILIELPKEAIDFIKDFDKRGYKERESMKPIEFDIEIDHDTLTKVYDKLKNVG